MLVSISRTLAAGRSRRLHILPEQKRDTENHEQCETPAAEDTHGKSEHDFENGPSDYQSDQDKQESH
jgi:hypothetical protein